MILSPPIVVLTYKGALIRETFHVLLPRVLKLNSCKPIDYTCNSLVLNHVVRDLEARGHSFF